ncbi:hypothetical protein GEMRC1_000502 [Eukaryota sp. GEM-RC1]
MPSIWSSGYDENSPFAPGRHVDHGACVSSCKDVFIVVFGYAIVLPVRAILLLLTIIIYWLLLRAITLGYWSDLYNDNIVTDPLPLSRRKLLTSIHRGMSRTFLLCYGCWIHQVGTPTLRHPTVANHVSFLDLFLLMSRGILSFVAMRELSTFPLISFMFRSNLCIFVDRLDRDDCKRAASILSSRFESLRVDPSDMSVPVTSIFPEGVITNQFQVIEFKTGVFRPLLPLHPVAISYPGKKFNATNVGYIFPLHLVRCLSQMVNHVHVDFSHDLVHPKLDETPKNFAIRCQTIIADLLGVPLSSAVCEDIVDWTSVVEGKMCRDQAYERYYARRKKTPPSELNSEVLNQDDEIVVLTPEQEFDVMNSPMNNLAVLDQMVKVSNP